MERCPEAHPDFPGQRCALRAGHGGGHECAAPMPRPLWVALKAVGIALLRRFPWWSQLLGAVAAVVALWLLYTVLDGILKPAFEGVGPSWLHEELGILVTGAICLVGGVLLARSVGHAPRWART